MSLVSEFTKGLWRQIPPFRLVFGLCSSLAVTQGVDTAIGMGAALTFVLVGSNIMISMMRNIIPNKVRIASFIVTVVTFVVIVELCMRAYVPVLSEKIGIFVSLIVCNCIVMGRAEAFASKNGVLPSIADGLGIGLGYTMSLILLGSIREIFGKGTWAGIKVFSDGYHPFRLMVDAPGAFICLGLLLGLMNFAGEKK